MKCYVVDAFAEHVFEGNPAAVCVMDQWIPDELMQSIAAENNLAETAFTVKEELSTSTQSERAEGDGGAVRYRLRFFTRTYEIELCGHATLATTYVLDRFYEPNATKFTYITQRRGELTALRVGKGEAKETCDGEQSLPDAAGGGSSSTPSAQSVRMYELNLPTLRLEPADAEREALLDEGLGVVSKSHRYNMPNRDIICVLDSEEAVRNLTPNHAILAKLPKLGSGFFVTARVDPASPSGAKGFDFVSRAFFPLEGLEDPVCGSAHCSLVPYWSEVFTNSNSGGGGADAAKKTDFTARQVSKRGGTLYCSLTGADGERLKIRGNAVLYSESELHV